ncbi:2-amino-4-hydroxy-6-hydroxymethyldihydropteridine diphosphokinase [Gemmobacter serpentinus]|uniref:2-amino-4-hydroxy-6- hydroxymethyldihydropteridine diphosphokinase n=1 Tax=Gemmobacter serpentinus TaxID=2652247 RepID=UPI00124CB996|nr:2-amino-4-hydroxy-6-hydroxymethyldihydropteridine diphosphokinase [Gemmobacter serpentinus]
MLSENPVIVAFGANLSFGDVSVRNRLQMATDDLAAEGLGVLRHSRYYATPCFPAGAGPDYVNAAAVLSADGMSAEAVLSALHRIEARHGRARQSRWAGRSLDIDLIAMGSTVLPDAETHRQWRELAAADQARLAPDQLILPHPRLQDRAFVLVPLAEVAPDWRHPLLHRSVVEMLADLPPEAVDEVKPLVKAA